MGGAAGEGVGCVVAHPKGCGTEGEIGVRYGEEKLRRAAGEDLGCATPAQHPIASEIAETDGLAG